MTTAERYVPKHAPHLVFGWLWTIWYADVWLAHIWLGESHGPRFALVTLLAFFPCEFVALRLNWRWTLSAVVTWIVKHLSKHDRPFTGWNWLVDLVAFPIALLLYRTVHAYVPGFDGYLLGGLTALALHWMLHQHWLRPDVHG